MLETLQRTRSNIGEYNFAGQYQQTPAPAGGGMVKEAWFRRYRPERRPASFDQIVQSWDTANKPSELADYSVCTTWGVKGPQFYLLNVLRKKLDFPNLKRAVREQADLFSPMTILKGRSSHKLLSEFGVLRKRYWGQHLWARGYWVVSSGNVTDDMWVEYIKNQTPPEPDDNFNVT